MSVPIALCSLRLFGYMALTDKLAGDYRSQRRYSADKKRYPSGLVSDKTPTPFLWFWRQAVFALPRLATMGIYQPRAISTRLTAAHLCSYCVDNLDNTSLYYFRLSPCLSCNLLAFNCFASAINSADIFSCLNADGLYHSCLVSRITC